MKNGHTIIALTLLLFSCSKANDKYEPPIPDAATLSDYHGIAQDIANNYKLGGFGVISRTSDGEPEHQGEALIWGGTYMWAASCSDAKGVSGAMAQMIVDNEGQLIRVDPLGEYAGGREITIDGAIGMFLGISRRVKDCGEGSLWGPVMDQMISFQENQGGILHLNAPATITGFRYTRDLVAGKEPGDHQLRDFENSMAVWAAGVNLKREACYRVNLGFSSLVTAETMGRSVSRDKFCQATSGMEIPTVSHWCGRQNIQSYISSYLDNQWEYRHQRCQWESPDGKDNISPKLDKLVAYVFENGWHSLQN